MTWTSQVLCFIGLNRTWVTFLSGTGLYTIQLVVKQAGLITAQNGLN